MSRKENIIWLMSLEYLEEDLLGWLDLGMVVRFLDLWLHFYTILSTLSSTICHLYPYVELFHDTTVLEIFKPHL